MNPDTIRIHPRERFQPLDSLHLIFHFNLSALTVNNILESLTAVRRTVIIDHEYHVTMLSHIHFPHPQGSIPCIGYQL